jgi:hypothetical protein
VGWAVVWDSAALQISAFRSARCPSQKEGLNMSNQSYSEKTNLKNVHLIAFGESGSNDQFGLIGTPHDVKIDFDKENMTDCGRLGCRTSTARLSVHCPALKSDSSW